MTPGTNPSRNQILSQGPRQLSRMLLGIHHPTWGGGRGITCSISSLKSALWQQNCRTNRGQDLSPHHEAVSRSIKIKLRIRLVHKKSFRLTKKQQQAQLIFQPSSKGKTLSRKERLLKVELMILSIDRASKFSAKRYTINSKAEKLRAQRVWVNTWKPPNWQSLYHTSR